MADKATNSKLEPVHAQEIFHKHEWLVQRIGWVILALFISAACTGVFGNGPLAEQKFMTGDMQLDLDRFARRHASAQWTLAVRQVRGNPLIVRINAAFLNHYRITEISPTPTRSSLAGPNVTFEFELTRAAGDIVFHVEPEQVGINEGEFRVGSSAPIRVRQVIFP